MSDLKPRIFALVDAAGPSHVWVPTDFAQLGSRDAVDKALQRMVQAGELRRIDRGLYDRPSLNRLTKRPTSPDYRAVVEAIARRDHLRLLVNGMTAANALGLADAVPARVTRASQTATCSRSPTLTAGVSPRWTRSWRQKSCLAGRRRSNSSRSSP